MTPGGEVSFNCPINMRLFPFDTETCHVILSSWMYISERVTFNAVNKKFINYQVSGGGIWKLIGISTEEVLEHYPSGLFSQIDFSITFKRKSLYSVMAPTIMLALLNLLLFILASSSGYRIQLGMTIIVSHFVFLLVTRLIHIFDT